MKERIKNVLNFKKHSCVMIMAAIALVAVLSAGCAVNRAADGYDTVSRLLTLEDIRRLAKLGDQLAVADLADFDATYISDDNATLRMRWRYPIEGGRWDLEAHIKVVDGFEQVIGALLIPNGYDFLPAAMIDIRNGGVDEYISFVESYDGTQTQLSATEEAAARAAALAYETRIFGDQVGEISRITDVAEFAELVIIDRVKGKLAAFYVTIDNQNPRRSITLTQSESGEWEVINEGW
jgi:hypothetical protein